jgi:hypothetical protein
MRDVCQIKAEIPVTLRRQVYAKLAMTDEKFTRWLRRKLEEFVDETEDGRGDKAVAVNQVARG